MLQFTVDGQVQEIRTKERKDKTTYAMVKLCYMGGEVDIMFPEGCKVGAGSMIRVAGTARKGQYGWDFKAVNIGPVKA